MLDSIDYIPLSKNGYLFLDLTVASPLLNFGLLNELQETVDYVPNYLFPFLIEMPMCKIEFNTT